MMIRLTTTKSKEREKMEENPFRVLGLDPQGLKGLKAEQFKAIIRSQYLALQKIHHPDKQGGDGEKTRRLNWAREELDNRFSLWLKFSTQKGRASKLEADLERATSLMNGQQSFTMRLYIEMYRQSLAGHYVDILNISKESIVLGRGPYSPQDSLLAGFRKEIKDPEVRRKAREEERQRIINQSFLKLSVSEGRLREENFRGEVKDISNRLLVGVIPDLTIRRYFDMKATSLCAFLEKVCPIGDGKPRKGLSFRYQLKGEDELAIDLSMARFARLFPYLSLSAKVTTISECSYLFSMVISNGRPTFRFEGCIHPEIPKASVTRRPSPAK